MQLIYMQIKQNYIQVIVQMKPGKGGSLLRRCFVHS